MCWESAYIRQVNFFIFTTVRKFWSAFYQHVRSSVFYTSLPQQRCSGTNILRVTPVTFLYISHKPPLRSWTWLYRQKANKMTFPTISCPYRNIVHFSYTSWIHFSANNTSFRPFKLMGLSISDTHTHRHTDTEKWKQYIIGGYKNWNASKLHQIFCASCLWPCLRSPLAAL